QFFRQFALTIAVSTVISAFNSLTLSPALAALLLRPRVKGKTEPMPGLAFALAGLLLGARLGWEAPWSSWLEDRALTGLFGHGAVLDWWSHQPVAHGLPAGGLLGLAIGAVLGWPLAGLSGRVI